MPPRRSACTQASVVQTPWSCEFCTLSNPGIAVVCDACGNKRPQATGSRGSSWACEACTLENAAVVVNCEVCGTRKPQAAPAKTTAPSVPTFKPQPRRAQAAEPARAPNRNSEGGSDCKAAPVARRKILLARPPVPVSAPESLNTWEEELWRLRRLYGVGLDDNGKDKGQDFCVTDEVEDMATDQGTKQKQDEQVPEATEESEEKRKQDATPKPPEEAALDGGGIGGDGTFKCRRLVRLVLHCTDPDWEAVNWAPEGLLMEISVPASYPVSVSELPELRVLRPEDLPQRFASTVPALFLEYVKTAPPRSPAIFRGLQYVDRHLTALYLKIREASFREMEANEAAELADAAVEIEDLRRRQRAEARQQESPRVASGDSNKKHSGSCSPAQNEGEGSESASDGLSMGLRPSGAVSNAAASGWSSQEVRRLGVEVRLLGLSFEGFDTITPRVIRLQAVCLRCKKPTDLASEEIDQRLEPRSAKANCNVCKQDLEIRIAPSISHGGSASIAHVLGIGCQPTQLLRSDCDATCGSCTELVRVRNVGPGYRKKSSCASCHTPLNLLVEGAELIGQAVQHWRQVAEVEGERVTARRQLQEARQRERDMGIKVGQPLPGNGTCKHFSKSYRWMRFPCCGKAFPCGECHDDQTDHAHEWANRMLCGLCSHEQPFSKDKCAHCGAAQTRSKSSFWEGGEGCRNIATMSKNDSRKYRGLGKCLSNHAAARTKKGS
eukprot:TRINITY_DN55763_c0_g1_i1.p1 TRINITY_DN55763_c0_g1~~TRINITY_DN55763_c0_g1_i1.p1  ORF type:complete len:724 (-),score=119.95 TRINITY_DN55763_c0_g1_i1:540-2711(-)